MLDTQIFDLLLDHPDLVEALRHSISEDQIEVQSTHIQNGEIRNMPPEKAEKRAALGELLKLTRTGPVGAFMVGLSSCEDRVGDGYFIKVDDIRTDRAGRQEDSLIAVSADTEADILVTEDKGLFQSARRAAEVRGSELRVWSWAEFCEFIRTLG